MLGLLPPELPLPALPVLPVSVLRLPLLAAAAPASLELQPFFTCGCRQ